MCGIELDEGSTERDEDKELDIVAMGGMEGRRE